MWQSRRKGQGHWGDSREAVKGRWVARIWHTPRDPSEVLHRGKSKEYKEAWTFYVW